MTNDFKTTCSDGEPHTPKEARTETVCTKCGQKIVETGEYSGYWFTPEDFINWDIVYNGVEEK